MKKYDNFAIYGEVYRANNGMIVKMVIEKIKRVFEIKQLRACLNFIENLQWA